MRIVKSKTKSKSWRVYVLFFFVIAAIFPVIAMLKRDPQMSSISSTNRYLMEACARNDEVTIRQLTTKRGFLALRKIKNHHNFSTYAQLQQFVKQLPDIGLSAFPGRAIHMTPFSEFPPLPAPRSADYRCEWQGWKLDNTEE